MVCGNLVRWLGTAVCSRSGNHQNHTSDKKRAANAEVYHRSFTNLCRRTFVFIALPNNRNHRPIAPNEVVALRRQSNACMSRPPTRLDTFGQDCLTPRRDRSRAPRARHCTPTSFGVKTSSCLLEGTTMCRINLLALIVAFTAAMCSPSKAAGSFQTKPAFSRVVTAGVAVRTSSISVPDFSARDLVGGCGRGRIRDPQTHTCRGPADIR